jgi:S1-C subfamily serine protease
MSDSPLKLLLYPLVLGLVLGLGFFVGLDMSNRNATAEQHNTPPQEPTNTAAPATLAPSGVAAAPADPAVAAPTAAATAAPSPVPAEQLTSLRLDPTLGSRTDLAPHELATIGLFHRVSPSVVFVTSIAQRRDFFSMRVGEYESGRGSGFVWDRNGHIVTNYHVIEGATAGIKVTMSDQSVLDATIVGTAPEKDLAVLRVEYDPSLLSPLPVGRSDDLLVGQDVLAIGNPFGLDQTLTTGIISALGRTIASADANSAADIADVIQTDAAINPGNSGGPLLDSQGRLIGVNTAIASPSGAYAGVGFAIPVDTVRWVVPDLIQYGRVQRPSLGFTAFPVSVNRQLRFAGVMIQTITPDGPAAAAELRGAYRDERGRLVIGDIITAIDDEPINTPGDLLLVLEKHTVGDVLRVTYVRDRRAYQANLELVTE